MSRWLGAWNRLRLGTRLAFALAALSLVVFAIVGALTVGIMRDYLRDRLDDQLTSSQLDESEKLRKYPAKDPTPFYSWYSVAFEVRDGVATPKPEDRLPQDVEDLAGVARAATETEVIQTVHLRGEGDFRVRACPIDRANGTVLVSAAPEAELDSTVQQLIAVEVATFSLALAILVITGRIVLRRGLRPLSDMADTAHDITTRDLTDSPDLPVRATGTGGGAEVDELRTALNTMLAHIDSSLGARTAAEQRLRRFIADASHELRTPLTSIRGYADLFQYAAANEPAEREAHLARLRQEASRMSLLLDDLLLLARLDDAEAETPLRREELDLADLVATAGDAFRAAHADHPLTMDISDISDISDTFATEPGPIRLSADPLRLRQVLDNLLTNAAVHTPAGTAVTLTARASAGEVVLEVADAGPGIPAGDQARIFDRFYRVDRSRARQRGGSGLGLAVVHSLVTAHGGTVTLASSPDGTRFTVRLPRTRNEDPR
ncbi:sensor histidine kinase [Amycolatopsis albispora]|uniref:histidine kinase n=1 Tax=Amycolatopsis albispora TaxID=1804986 RepID=A0A344L4W1_9PSEU|nr:HAMP domain-containing sensor histidine kinase [Amycolatopsis albispora]AXB43085.1 histidine kinase [Amycolatopsis albispora]